MADIDPYQPYEPAPAAQPPARQEAAPPAPAGDSITIGREELAAMIADAVRSHVAAQNMAMAGLSRRTPEELLADHDLPVTPEVAALLSHVPVDRQDWLLRVGMARLAILRRRPLREIATIFDHLNGHPTDYESGNVGPALASMLTTAAAA